MCDMVSIEMSLEVSLGEWAVVCTCRMATANYAIQHNTCKYIYICKQVRPSSQHRDYPNEVCGRRSAWRVAPSAMAEPFLSRRHCLHGCIHSVATTTTTTATTPSLQTTTRRSVDLLFKWASTIESLHAGDTKCRGELASFGPCLSLRTRYTHAKAGPFSASPRPPVPARPRAHGRDAPYTAQRV